jgi:hypothetical protein
VTSPADAGEPGFMLESGAHEGCISHHVRPMCRLFYRVQGCKHCSFMIFKRLMLSSQWHTRADGPELFKKVTSHAAIQVCYKLNSAPNSEASGRLGIDCIHHFFHVCSCLKLALLSMATYSFFTASAFWPPPYGCHVKRGAETSSTNAPPKNYH